MFGSWNYLTNLEYHYNGRVYLTWRPDYYHVRHVIGTAQSIACMVIDIISQVEFHLTIVYAFITREDKRELWQHLESISGGMWGILIQYCMQMT